MKHLFYIHSNITELVARQVIEEEGYEEKDSLFLLARNHKSEFPNQIIFPYTHYPVDTFRVSFFFWKNRTKVTNLDRWLDKITEGKPFTYYTPQSGMNFFYLIISHINCKHYCYIEEGLCSYLREDELRSKKKELWIRDQLYNWNFKGRSPSVKHFYDLNHVKYLAAYGISEHSFPGLIKRKTLNLPFVKTNENNTYEHVLVLGQYVEYGEMKKETLIAVIQYLLSHLIKNKITNLHIKYHPAQKEESSIGALTNLFTEYKSQINIILMGPNTVLENIAISTGASFYIISSSVGIYSAINGNNVYCLAKKVVEVESQFQKKIDSFPDFFKSRLIYL
jgi:hypothetical protein